MDNILLCFALTVVALAHWSSSRGGLYGTCKNKTNTGLRLCHGGGYVNNPTESIGSIGCWDLTVGKIWLWGTTLVAMWARSQRSSKDGGGTVQDDMLDAKCQIFLFSAEEPINDWFSHSMANCDRSNIGRGSKRESQKEVWSLDLKEGANPTIVDAQALPLPLYARPLGGMGTRSIRRFCVQEICDCWIGYNGDSAGNLNRCVLKTLHPLNPWPSSHRCISQQRGPWMSMQWSGFSEADNIHLTVCA